MPALVVPVTIKQSKVTMIADLFGGASNVTYFYPSRLPASLLALLVGSFVLRQFREHYHRLDSRYKNRIAIKQKIHKYITLFTLLNKKDR